jgi:hypothetical protein
MVGEEWPGWGAVHERFALLLGRRAVRVCWDRTTREPRTGVFAFDHAEAVVQRGLVAPAIDGVFGDVSLGLLLVLRHPARFIHVHLGERTQVNGHLIVFRFLDITTRENVTTHSAHPRMVSTYTASWGIL